MYIDDCNVFGKDIDELISTLRLVFERFKKHKIFLKPNKCYLGYAEICTTMHFLSDTDPIYLHTDASDYGVGAYLFQLVDGQETPIAFVSKSLNKAQLRGLLYRKKHMLSFIRARI